MVLRHRDRELLRFEWVEPQGVRVLSVNESERKFLPLEMKGVADDASLWSWLSHRTVPRNRRHIEGLMARFGLNSRNIRGIIELCRGLSLNDVHWVVDDNFRGTWAECNLYDNPFSKAVSLVAFSGMGPSVETGWTSSPEFTTNGMLAKQSSSIQTVTWGISAIWSTTTQTRLSARPRFSTMDMDFSPLLSIEFW